MVSLKRLVLTSVFVLAMSMMVPAQKRNGTYYRSDEYGRGDITFREVKRGKTKRLNFEISIAGARRGTCIGSLKGKAKWVDENVAEFNSDLNERDPETGEVTSCQLTFIFKRSGVIVKESNCDESHGMMCQFEGKFKRRSN